MAAILGIWGMLALLAGFLLLAVAKSAIHEIEAGLAFLIATVAIGTGCIVEAIQDLRKNLKKEHPDAPRRTLKQWMRDERPADLDDAATRAAVRSYKNS
jgi:cobalamin biosynthesis protein CobD/CbiB